LTFTFIVETTKGKWKVLSLIGFIFISSFASIKGWFANLFYFTFKINIEYTSVYFLSISTFVTTILRITVERFTKDFITNMVLLNCPFVSLQKISSQICFCSIFCLARVPKTLNWKISAHRIWILNENNQHSCFPFSFDISTPEDSEFLPVFK
jgi:hypothetical protein